ncbi:MAG: NAD(P)/FAD-dependent oxidoreductase [Pseudomonadota bacterium]
MSEHFDVLIVGAGLSGIGAAWHLHDKCPNKTFAILEGRDAMGGTWDLFRYPGIRSDSDMYTLGYNFKPWTDTQIIADGARIRRYIQETASETGVDKKVRYGHKVVSAAWSSESATWTVQVLEKATGQTKSMSCNFLMMCSGYYNYQQGITPDFKGREDFKGPVIHPQFWPENLDYTGKRVVVIGSGATAVTLVPSMTEKAQHVTMLQRSPSYVITVPQRDTMAEALRKFLPEMWVYRMGRTRNILLTSAMFRLSRTFPNAMRKLLQKQVRMQVGKDFDMTHFTPKYNPWDQRLCAVPNGDMFRVLKKGKASIVTDHIDRFTDKGILLKSGKELPADIIVTATGLDLQLFGGMALTVDGQAVKMSEKLNYKGMMFNDLPNLSNTLGYTNASWTLKADLIAEYVCRLLKHMDATGTRISVPRQNDPTVKEAPFLDMTSGYVALAAERLPKGGNKAPWKLYQNYTLDMNLLRHGTLDDGVMEFAAPRQVP